MVFAKMHFNILYFVRGLDTCVRARAHAWKNAFNSDMHINKYQMKVCQVLYIGPVQ